VSDARVENVPTDRLRAREFFAQAQRFFDDADIPELNNESRAVLLHSATLAACDAILQAVGLRVTSGDGAHILRIQTALAQIEQDTEELLESLDASRERRNEASYAALYVPVASVADAREATAELIELARGSVDT
jgi:hypothetical protein